MQKSIIIVGSGINGLVAAAHLSSQGKRVLVLEQAEVPGGAVGTRELTLPGFRHDIGAMNLSAFAGSAFMRVHGETLAKHGLKFVHARRPFAQALADGDHIGISTDMEETLSTFHSARDRETWKALVARFPAWVNVLGALLSKPAAPLSIAGTALQALRTLGLSESLDLLRFLISSPRAWLDRTFDDHRLRSALSSWGMHLDFAPDIAGGAMFPYLEGVGGQLGGMLMPEGGANGVTDALVHMIEHNGGEIRCGQNVQHIQHRDGQVTGVSTETSQLDASIVLACVAPRNLQKLIGDSGNHKFDAGMASFVHGPGTMMIHLALDAQVPWRAAALQHYAYVHIANNIDTAARAYTEAMAGLLPTEPVLVVGQPTVYDPTRAPANKHVLWVQVRVLPSTIKGDAKGEITATAWAAAKHAMAERVLDIIESQAPGFRSHILKAHVVSPDDLQAGNPNLVGGDQVCGSHHLSQNYIFRPLRGYADGTTPIKGLHLIGAATWPGAGSGAGSGFLKARSLS